jgi:uncharacterized membrane protein YfcA
MSGQAISLVIAVIILIALALMALKYIFWIGVGVVLGIWIGAHLANLVPYWNEAKRRF